MSLDDCGIIKMDDVVKILQEYKSFESFSQLSEHFANSEPEATVLITDRIDQINESIIGKVHGEDLTIAIEDLAWVMFLVGYEIGKKTHSFKLEDYESSL